MYSFRLLNALFTCNPLATLSPYLPTIFNLLLHRMQETAKENKKARYCRLFLHSLCVFSAVHGPQVLCQSLEALTNGLVSMLVMNIWPMNVENLAGADDLEVKQTVVGATRLLTEAPLLTQKPEVWISLLRSTFPLMGSGGSNAGDQLHLGDEEAGGDGMEFDSAYSKLAYATIPPVDPCADVDTSAIGAYFGQRMNAFLKTSPNMSAGIAQALSAEEQRELQKLL